MNAYKSIIDWMQAHAHEFVDECDEINSTAMVEAWDRECSSGCATLNSNHPAWEVAAKIADKHETSKKRLVDSAFKKV